MTGRRLVILIALGAALVIAPSAFADDGDGGGRRGPFNQGPGSGGSGGGDPCQISVKGTCESMTIYPGGHTCTARWCEPEASAMFKCGSHLTMSCPQGEDSEGKTIYIETNDCAFCGL